MTDRIQHLATLALSGDRFPPFVEHTADDPNSALSIGKALEEYFRLQPIEFREEEYLCDRYRFFGMQNTPSCYYRSMSKDRWDYWSTLCATQPTPLFYWGWTHVALDFGYLLQNGLTAYYRRIEVAKEVHQDDQEKLDFLCGMQHCLDGIVARYQAYQKEAARLAELETDPPRKGALLRLADTFTRIPLHGAESFFDAVQFTWIGFLLAADSLGRIDQYLYPYYQKDLESGKLTEAFAFELLEELFIKVYESQSDNTALDISGHNHLVVGGYLENGEDGFNPLSRVILEAIADLPTYRPQASFRYTKHTTRATMRYITELNKKSQLIVFVNDEPRINGMVKCGIDDQDAVNYSVIGCNEWAIVGKSKLDLAHVNLVHALESALYEREEPASYEECYRLFEEELQKDFDTIIAEYANYAEAQAKENNVLTSIFHDDCIENAKALSRNGTKYYGLTLSFNSISTVADSLSVIKHFVFEEKKFTYAELLAALKADWQGYEEMHRLILREGRFFGNDDDYVDAIACDIVDSVYRIKGGVQSPYIKNLIVGSFVGATHPNLIFGKLTRATPDGRQNRDAFPMGISQSEGKDKKGVTALLKSIAKLDYSKFCGCVVSNLKLDKAMADTPEKLDRLAILYHTFLQLGGMQLQINYLSSKELLEAQQHPECYQNLMVRVTGYSGFFTRFDRDLQNDIIRRTEQR